MKATAKVGARGAGRHRECGRRMDQLEGPRGPGTSSTVRLSDRLYRHHSIPGALADFPELAGAVSALVGAVHLCAASSALR
jgi:hypothetical protein